jgi:hypothetical protein
MIGVFLTIVKTKTLEYTWKRYIPFYWLYYIIKMNIKKQYFLFCLKQDINHLTEYGNTYLSDSYCYIKLKILRKTINKINKL